MNIKFIKYFMVCFLAHTIYSCSTEFLEVEPEGIFIEENYYTNADQAYSALIAVYDVLGKQSKTFENMIVMMNAGSDDFNAGGGGPSDGIGLQSFNDYSIDASTVPPSFWNDFYQGIYRANILLQRLPDIDMDEDLKERFTAEARALRGNYYFELVRLFRNIPLITEPFTVVNREVYEVGQVSPETIYAQIEADLNAAIPNLPMTIGDLQAEGGRLTQGTAKALLGKVLLYQDKNQEAAAQFADVNGTPGATSVYGYRLVDNFSSLFQMNTNFNTEGILQVASTTGANVNWDTWGGGQNEGNSVNLMVGPRGYSRTENSTAPDYATGWSFNPVTQDLYDVMQDDPRFDVTIEDVEALREDGQVTYTAANQNTGYFLKKFLPLTTDISTGGGVPELNYTQTVYIIRLADTYLMEAEALGGTGDRAQALLDAVRARVGLPSIPVSLDAIMRERRLELAGEGHRWFDLVRTGRAPAVLGDRNFVQGKHEILPIPLVELENTELVQNPNY